MRKNKSGIKGVTLRVLNGKNYYWECRVQGRINFRKRFPFTERGKELAGKCYQRIIEENREKYYNYELSKNKPYYEQKNVF